MMKTIRILSLLFTAFLISTHAFAESKIYSEDSFAQIQKIIQQDQPHHPGHHLLLVLDDDDTLTMVPCYPYSVGFNEIGRCGYLGGPAWFSWQAGLPAKDPQRVWKTFSQLLSINNMILNMTKMPLDDPSIPAALATAHQQGDSILVASARGYSMLGATENQFQQDGILNTIEQNAIKTPTGHISFPGYYFPTAWGKHTNPRRIAYIDGVLYLSGQNKGVMLQQFLAKTHQAKKFTRIVFVDDTMKNVKDVATAYANNPGNTANPQVRVISIHFTRLNTHKAALTQSLHAKQFQVAATNEWKNLETVMKKNLLGSNF